MKVKQTPILLVLPLLLFTSCAPHYSSLHQKGYCIQKKYLNDYSEVEINDKAVFQEGRVDYKVPFLFKADSIIYLKDTMLTIFEDQFVTNVFRLSTSFSYLERRGFAASPSGKSQNKFSLRIFISNQLNPERWQKEIKKLATTPSNHDHFNQIEFLDSPDKNKDCSVIYLEQNAGMHFQVDNFLLFIPTPLPEGQYHNPTCGISGNGGTFIWESLAFYCKNGGSIIPGNEDDLFTFMKSNN